MTTIMRRVPAMVPCAAVLGLLANLALPPALHGAGGAAVKVPNKVPHRVEAFDLQDITLLDGPFKQAMLRDQQFLLGIDQDRLLHNLRVTAGLRSSAKPYGGWEAPDVELRGHTAGHYMSALALMYRSTRDERFRTLAKRFVAELAKIQQAMPAKGFSKGYLSAYPESLIDRVEKRERVWAPYYTLHKIMAGLLDVHLLCDNPQALDVVSRMADWVGFRMGRLTFEQQQAMLETEFGGMAEVLANLYAATGTESYLKTAQTFDHRALFDPLAKGVDPLDGLHGNTQFPKIIGAVREFELTGDRRYLEIARFFWRRVALSRSFVIGGNTDAETFFPIAEFSRHLGASSTETCNTYNMLKLTRALYQLEPQPEQAEFYERGLFNHILASQDPATGMMCYYVPLAPGAFKTYNSPDQSFWCCTGTGMENHAKYGDSIYFHDAASLYVNLFIASQLEWKEKGLTVRQQTAFPEDDTTRLLFDAETPVHLAVKVRYPLWAKSGMTLTINGQAREVTGKPGSYVTVERDWRMGDMLIVQIPMTLRTEAMPDDAKTIALLYGPIVLAGDLGTDGLDGVNRLGPTAPPLGRMRTPAIPAFVTSDVKNVATAIKPLAGGPPLTFATSGLGQPHDVTLRPFYKASDFRYTVYWKVYTPAEWKTKNDEAAATESRRKQLEAATVDVADVDSDQSEAAHAYKGERASTGFLEARRYRQASGSITYTLKVTRDKPMRLVCTYRGSEGQRRVFDVLVDGRPIASESLAYHPTATFDVEYPLPDALTQGKDRVTVTFQAQAGAVTGGVFEVRTVGQ